METLRLCPWLEKTAMVICDIYAEDEDVAVPVAPRQILKDQLAKAAKMGYTVKTGSELEFYLFKDCYDELAERGYRDVQPSLDLHHGLPHAPDHQGRMDHPPDPQRDARRRHPDRVLQGRVRQGPARDQHHLLRRPVERRPSLDLQARREGDRGAERRRRPRSWRSGRWTRRARRATCTQRVERRRHRVAHVGRRRRRTT